MTGLDYRDIPVMINSFNRLETLQQLVAWLERAGHRRIVVLDNASTYRPLLEYLRTLRRERRAQIVHLGENVGHLALWSCGMLERLGIKTEFVYTDPDVVPCDSCPLDIVDRLASLLRNEPLVYKAGLGLRIDDLPETYVHRETVVRWELQYWRRPAAPGLFFAPIDTTFALYRPGSEHGLDRPAIRTGYPLVARHGGWYGDSASPSHEDRYYRATVRGGVSHWDVVEVPQWLQTELLNRPPEPDVAIALTEEVHVPGVLPISGSTDIVDASLDVLYVPHAGTIASLPYEIFAERALRDSGVYVVRMPLSDESPDSLAEQLRWRWSVIQCIDLLGSWERVVHLRPRRRPSPDADVPIRHAVMQSGLDSITDFWSLAG